MMQFEDFTYFVKHIDPICSRIAIARIIVKTRIRLVETLTMFFVEQQLSYFSDDILCLSFSIPRDVNFNGNELNRFKDMIFIRTTISIFHK